jgi:hypothetical protein
MAKKPKTIEHLDASIGRWKTRLRRAVTMIDKLEKQRKRIAAKPPKPVAVKTPEPKPEPVAVTIMRQAAPDPTPVKAAEIDTGIPAFLQRKPLDPVAQQIADEQAETKKKKALGRIAKMKAKKSGETKKMPLTGRAALDAIRNA